MRNERHMFLRIVKTNISVDRDVGLCILNKCTALISIKYLIIENNRLALIKIAILS